MVRRQRRCLAGAAADRMERKLFLAWCKPVEAGFAHTQTHAVGLGFEWGRRQLRTPPKISSTVLKLLQHCKARTKTIPSGHKIFSSSIFKTLSSCPLQEAVEWHLSRDVCSSAKHFSLLSQGSCSQKKAKFCGQKSRMRQETLVTEVSGLLVTPPFYIIFSAWTLRNNAVKTPSLIIVRNYFVQVSWSATVSKQWKKPKTINQVFGEILEFL